MELLCAPMRGKKRAADDDLDAFRKGLGGGGSLRANAERFVAFLMHAGELEARERGAVRLLEEARAAALARRRRAGALGFGDLLRAARDGLRDQPDLAETVCSEATVLLVDEFQDTSSVQRDLVYLLRERDDARRGRRPGAMPAAAELSSHGLFLVGDRKQSIYGFRGADVAVFSRICAELGGEAAAIALRLGAASGAGAGNADFVALAESRRSGAAVLGFVNVFSACDFSEGRAAEIGPRDFEIEYSPAEHLVPVRPPEERGHVILIEDDAAVPDGADALVREAEGPLREALIAAAWIARHRADTGRPAREIALLARRRNTLPLVSVALDRLGVPYVVAGRALYDAPEVRDVAALARLVVDPRDRLALATVLRGPCVSLSDTALAALSEPGRGLSYLATMTSLPERAELLTAEEHRRLAAFRGAFAALRRAALRAPPAEALRALVVGFDLDRALAALPRAEARLANVDRLITIARDRGGSLASFVRWLERRIDDESDEPEGVVFSDEDDAVRLLTIHGSKGLDFPVVVLVDLAAEPRPTYPGIDLVPAQGDRPASLLLRHFGAFERAPDGEPAPLLQLPTPALRAAQAEARSREQAERRRLTYVALTRARDVVALVAPATPPRGSSAWRTLAVALPPEARAAITRLERAADLLNDAQERMARAAQDRQNTSSVVPPRDGASAPRDGASAPRDGASAPRDGTSPRGSGASPRDDDASPRGPHLGHRDTPRAAPRDVALPTTALSLFEGCARRYRLRYLLGFDEPLASTQLDLFTLPEGDGDAAVAERLDDEDARDVGRAAHRVLERWPAARWGEAAAHAEIVERLVGEGIDRASPEVPRLAAGIARWLDGPYVRAARAADATLLREEPFVLEVTGRVGLTLRGAMDLVVRLPGERVDVIDYKRSRPRADLSPYSFQLRAYALSLSRRFPGHRVRAGVLFLGAGDEPVWLDFGHGAEMSDRDQHAFESTLASLAEAYSAARAADVWDGVPIEKCRALHCGFVTACHRKGKGR